jgi:hypothetical protein
MEYYMASYFFQARQPAAIAAAILMLIAAASAYGCATAAVVNTPADEEKRAADIETLNTIMKLEQALKSYAETLPGVGNADVKIRPNAAVAILTPAAEGAVSEDTAEQLRLKIASETGMPPENVTVIRKHK